ncbi:hypothetical protein KY342_05135, partial [Candidatus Woesearchaeota archaeon]|nr:hypothetical protein [Candidatus Woesearchaeota archaeon]
MPKQPEKTNPRCPFCKNKTTIKWGLRKNKRRTIQKFKCKNKTCRKYFTNQPNLQKHKTYKLNLILSTISNLNLGYSLKQTSNYFRKLPRSTISYWYNQLKPTLPYHRIRNQIKTNYKPIDIIKKKRFIHHNQPFLYQYHKPKLDLFLNKYKALKHYLENIETLLPKDIFKNSQRISKQKQKAEKELKTKQNYATKLAETALQSAKDNRQRHLIIENLMLRNDTATIATEIPIYLTNPNLTGHIDILQIRYHKIYILDFKPEKINKQKSITQLQLY